MESQQPQQQTGLIPSYQKEGGGLAIRPEGLPEFINHGREGLIGVETIREYIQPPRLKVVQPQSSPELKSQFNEGDLIIMPQKELVAPIQMNQHGKPGDKGTAFLIVPIFQYTEFIAWNPLGTKGTLPPIRERESNPDSLLAKKCRNPKTRDEVCPEFPKDAEGKEQFIRNTEHLNFLVSLVSFDNLFDTPCCISFFRGEMKAGSSFCAAINMRHTDIFANQFLAQLSRRTNAKGNWFGFDITNPPFTAENDLRWVQDKALYDYFGQLHAAYSEAYKSGEILTDYDEESVVEGSATPVGDGGGKF
jgi:hypothetical protein